MFHVYLFVEGALLLALLAGLGRPVAAVAVVAAVALAADKGGDDGAVLARRRLPIPLHVLLALLADGRRVRLALLLELGAAVRALHHREGAAALLKESEWERFGNGDAEYFGDGKEKSAPTLHSCCPVDNSSKGWRV